MQIHRLRRSVPGRCILRGYQLSRHRPGYLLDCDLCVPECPVQAIYSEGELPEKWAEYLEINARLAVDWPEITQQKDPLPEADEFKDVQAKRDMLDESAGGN